MASPTTTYESGFPDIIFPGNLKEERSLQENVLLQRARDNNILSQEIKQIQAYMGGHSPGPGWTVGDDTFNDRLTRVGGTGSCWEDGTVCDYDKIDPTGSQIEKTGIITQWLDPTGIPFRPPVPPIGPGGAGNPWPGPGGGNPQGGGPVGGPGPQDPYTYPYTPWGTEVDDFGPWVPPSDNDGDGALDWNTTDFLQHLAWKSDTNMLRHEWASGENINLWAREYGDLFAQYIQVIELLDNWPSSRVNPSAHNPPRASMLDLFNPTTLLVNFVLQTLGIEIVTGTITSSTVIEFSVSVGINGGRSAALASGIVTLLANHSSGNYGASNITDVRVKGGGSIVGSGVAGGGDHEVVLGSGVPDVGEEVRVVFMTGLQHFATV